MDLSQYSNAELEAMLASQPSGKDLSSLSNEELARIAGVKLSDFQPKQPKPVIDPEYEYLSKLSDEELARIAGVELKPLNAPQNSAITAAYSEGAIAFAVLLMLAVAVLCRKFLIRKILPGAKIFLRFLIKTPTSRYCLVVIAVSFCLLFVDFFVSVLVFSFLMPPVALVLTYRFVRYGVGNKVAQNKEPD
jgi:hypothetical protein